MFRHIVMLELFAPNDSEQIRFLHQQCDYMQKEIPEVISVELVKNLSDRGHEYTHAIISDFSTSQAHDFYQTHPAHLLVKESLKKTIKSLLVLDYELN